MERVLDRYTLEREVGRGGMSVVFRAMDEQLGRPVAVKRLHQFLASDEAARQRLHREAMAVARLKHPNIVQIFDSSAPDAADAFLVTEFIEGQTLRAWADQHGTLPLAEAAVLVLLGVVRALRHAHEHGILHRDLKPENVMVSSKGQIKLMDFGIAQIVGEATKLTQTGAILGSPAHMAPEIIDGRNADHRADLYSLGTILFWLISGQLPYEAPNPSALFHRILEGRREPIHSVAPHAGNRLAQVVERCLSVDLEQRYQDIRELEEDLEAVLARVGWSSDSEQIEALMRDPVRVCRDLRPSLIHRLIAAAQASLANKQPAAAIDAAQQVLALEPAHRMAPTILQRATRRPHTSWPYWSGAVGFASITAIVAWTQLPPVQDRPSDPATQVSPRPTPADEAGTGPAGAATGPVARGTVAKAPPPDSTLRPRNPKSESEGASISRTTDRTSRANPVSKAGGLPQPELRARLKNVQRQLADPTSVVPRASEELRATGLHSVLKDPAAGVSELPETSRSPAPPKALRAPAPRAQLEVRIGRSFADIWVNGSVQHRNRYRASLELPVGRHRIEVVKPGLGRFLPREVEVLPSGSVVEHLEGGATQRGKILSFRVPRTPEEARSTARWKPSVP